MPVLMAIERVPLSRVQPLQVSSHFGSALVAQVAVFLQGFDDDLVELRRKLRVPVTGQFRNFVKDGSKRRAVVLFQKAGGRWPSHKV